MRRLVLHRLSHVKYFLGQRDFLSPLRGVLKMAKKKNAKKIQKV